MKDSFIDIHSYVIDTFIIQSIIQLYSIQVVLLKNPPKNLKILGYPLTPPPYKLFL